MAKETFEDQAAAVRNLISAGNIPRAERKHLECAARHLEALGHLRKKVMLFQSTEATVDQTDGLADDFLHLLHIPVPESS